MYAMLKVCIKYVEHLSIANMTKVRENFQKFLAKHAFSNDVLRSLGHHMAVLCLVNVIFCKV